MLEVSVNLIPANLVKHVYLLTLAFRLPHCCAQVCPQRAASMAVLLYNTNVSLITMLITTQKFASQHSSTLFLANRPSLDDFCTCKK